jgi:hypothetical protein
MGGSLLVGFNEPSMGAHDYNPTHLGGGDGEN